MWKAAADSGEPIALLTWATTALPGAITARRCCGTAGPGRTQRMPDIEYTPQVCLRLAQSETRYTSRKKALAQAAEAKQAFTILPGARAGRRPLVTGRAEQLLYALTTNCLGARQPIT